MKTKVLTTSEVAQMVMAMFPPTSKYTTNQTCIYGEDGNSVVHVQENESGNSKVRVKPYCWKTYGQLKAEDKKAAVQLINNLKVDKVTEILVFHTGEKQVSVQYFVAGAYEKYYPKKAYLVKDYTIEPFNY